MESVELDGSEDDDERCWGMTLPLLLLLLCLCWWSSEVNEKGVLKGDRENAAAAASCEWLNDTGRPVEWWRWCDWWIGGDKLDEDADEDADFSDAATDDDEPMDSLIFGLRGPLSCWTAEKVNLFH